MIILLEGCVYSISSDFIEDAGLAIFQGITKSKNGEKLYKFLVMVDAVDNEHSVKVSLTREQVEQYVTGVQYM